MLVLETGECQRVNLPSGAMPKQRYTRRERHIPVYVVGPDDDRARSLLKLEKENRRLGYHLDSYKVLVENQLSTCEECEFRKAYR